MSLRRLNSATTSTRCNPDFEVAYPDQLRADEFLNEFNNFVVARKAGHGTMPQFILLRLPNDHTAGGTKGKPKPTARLLIMTWPSGASWMPYRTALIGTTRLFLFWKRRSEWPGPC